MQLLKYPHMEFVILIGFHATLMVSAQLGLARLTGRESILPPNQSNKASFSLHLPVTCSISPRVSSRQDHGEFLFHTLTCVWNVNTY